MFGMTLLFIGHLAVIYRLVGKSHHFLNRLLLILLNPKVRDIHPMYPRLTASPLQIILIIISTTSPPAPFHHNLIRIRIKVLIYK
jgi:hypothetical protein